MKRLQVLFLVALSSTLLLFGCGKKEETTEPVVEQVIDDIEEPDTIEEAEETGDSDETDEAASQVDDDVPPEEGMVRSRITNGSPKRLIIQDQSQS